MGPDKAYCAAHAECIPGEYVMLAASDTGCGMDEDILDKIFEPFFTTKGSGKGTGLGLSTVYGIVSRNGGSIGVSSEPGRGTTFTIYLPRHTGPRRFFVRKNKKGKIPRGRGENVLVVEDDAAILKLVKNILQGLGYNVFAANSPGEALAMAEKFKEKTHLLITDVIMPEMNGRELADRIQSFSPNVKRLFMSGYTADVVADRVAPSRTTPSSSRNRFPVRDPGRQAQGGDEDVSADRVTEDLHQPITFGPCDIV